MSTVANMEKTGRDESLRVYYQNNEMANILRQSNASWELLLLPQQFPTDGNVPSVIVAESPSIFSSQLKKAVEKNHARLIYILGPDQHLPPEASGIPIFGFLASPVQAIISNSFIKAAFENLKLARHQERLEDDLQRARAEIDELNRIGIALSSQRDPEALLGLILETSREITSSDAGSLYLVEENEQGEKYLRFKATQNDSLSATFREFTMPINTSSIAGYVALSGEPLHLEDVYQIPPSLPFRFNPKFDQDSGYRTKSMLIVPMKNPQEEIIGVVQLINCKRDYILRVTPATVDEVVVPYPPGRQALVSSLASQAAVAIENNRLYESIQTLFEGFVNASVVAIEARDPTTSGHSFRVADLTVGLAEAVDRADHPSLRDIKFSRSEMKEIRYASLLHDFGKVGVREEVLVKARKLYPQQLDVVRQRFDYVRKAVQLTNTERKLEYILEKGRDDFLTRSDEFDHDLKERLQELDEFLQFVLKCNEPTVLPEGNFQRLIELAGIQFQDWEGNPKPLLDSLEANLLSIPKGSLDDRERKEIESHVVHTYNFLSQIPWTKEIRNIPTIARAHHEKLTGTGYPYKLVAAEIPFQSKLMTISDIYDALSASDRPYKRALPQDKALQILGFEAKDGFIDAELLKVFIEAGVFKCTENWKHPSSFNL